MATGSKIASLFAEIGADTTKLEQGLKDTKSGLTGAKNAFEMLTGSSLSAAGAFGVAATALKFSVGAAMESEKADANLAATLKSTKNAAGLTADEIKRLSANLAEMSGQDDEAVQNANSMLLTFTAIGRDVFPMASEAVVNMAAKFGSLDAASIQVGKALNDPIAGVTALRKVGVMLTDQQEASIKKFMEMNDIASAQKVILAELETEFGGLGAAMGATLEGKINRLKTSFGNLGETVGGAVIEFLRLGDGIDALNLLLNAGKKIDDTFQDFSKTMARTSGSYLEYAEAMLQAKIRTGEITEDQRRLLYAMEETEKGGIEAQMVAWGFLGAEEQRVIRLDNQMIEALQRTKIEASITAAGFDEFSYTLGATSLVTADFGKILKDLEQDKLARLNVEMQNYTTQLLFNQAAAGLDAAASRTLAEAMGLINPATSSALSILDAMKESMNAGSYVAGSFAEQVAALNRAIMDMKDKDITITTRMVTLYQGNQSDDDGRYKEVKPVTPLTPTSPEPPVKGGSQEMNAAPRGNVIVNVNTQMDYQKLLTQIRRDLARRK